MKKTLQIVLAAAFFAGCASTSVNSKSTSKISNEFMQNQLFEINKIVVNGKTFDPKNAEENPNISFENNKFYGYAGCNRFFGSYQSNENTLEIQGDRVASTQMLCHPLEVMEFENAFLSNFKGSFTISNKNGKLILNNGEMEIFFK